MPAPDLHPGSPRRLRWLGVSIVTSAPLVLALCWAMWRAPYPISETVALLQLAGVMNDAPGVSHFGIDPVVREIFDPTERSWYRPLYHMTWYVFWRATHSLAATLLLFRGLEILSVISLVLLFLWFVMPQTFIEYAAAMFAVTLLIGSPGLRENLEIPLLMTLVAMPLTLVAWMLLERGHRRWHGAAVLLLTAIAVGYKEQGLVLVPLIVVAWWTGAPGATRLTTGIAVALTVAYLAFRFTTAVGWQPFEQEVGFGFGVLSPDDEKRVGAFPYWMYAYSAGATASNILFSEPTRGTFGIVRDFRNGEWLPWEINHLVSSAAITILIAWWGVGTWKREAGQPWSAELRVFAAMVMAVAASAALSFNYSRDRLGGMAVLFYAMTAYFAVRWACERARQTSLTRQVTVAVALFLMSAAWQLRSIGTVDSVDLRATKVHREWLTDLQDRRTQSAGQTGFLLIMEAMAEQGLQPPPAPPPRWLEPWLGER